MTGLSGRRSGDQLQRTRHDLDDALALIGRMQRGYLKTITTLAQALEDKDPHTAGATERVTALTVRLGGRASAAPTPTARRWCSAPRCATSAGPACATPSCSRTAAWTRIEREEIKAHAELAARIVGELELPVAVKQMVRGHHERWDGTGYPDALSGEAIPLPARILAVAEAIDAMLSPRPWREPMTLEAALAEITANAGTQFCPHVASAAAGISPPDWGLHLNAHVHPSNPAVDTVQSAHNASSWHDVLSSAG